MRRFLLAVSTLLLAATWSPTASARAYYGMTVPHFPNLFIMYGPNTNTGGGSIIYFLETQAKYVADFVDRLARTGDHETPTFGTVALPAR